VIGSRLKRRSLAAQGHLAAAAGVSSAFAINVHEATLGHFDPLLLETVGACAALLYLCTRWSGYVEAGKRRRIPEAYTWAASTFSALLCLYELEPIAVAVAWTVLGLVLFEIGFSRKSVALRFQAYVALVASGARIFFVNINGPGEIVLRVATTVPLALACYYVYEQLQRRKDDFLATDLRFRAAIVHGFMGTLVVAATMRAESATLWVVAEWAALILVLLAVAWYAKRKIFLNQALLVAIAVFYRAVFYNFYERSYFSSDYAAGAGTAIALLFLSLPFALRLKAEPEVTRKEGQKRLARLWAAVGRRPDQFFFFAAFALLTALLWLKAPTGLLTVAWGVEAVVIFLIALLAGERSYRLSAMGLLLVCVGKIVVDLFTQRMEGSTRWLTAIGLGSALILVSFLYTRYREAIRRYL
jgi:hypothetical protein